jgi:hypothetical protein
MGFLQPQYVFDLETRMKMLAENEYLRLASSDFIWWNKLAVKRPSMTKREIVTWILNTAQIESQGSGGNFAFDSLTIMDREFTHDTHGKAFKLRRQQFEDLDGNGVQLAAEWASQIGAQQAYWPQKQIYTLLASGEGTTVATAYDNLAFFSASHPVNPVVGASGGTYSNLLSGGSAVPIHDGVSLETAAINLAKVYAHIAAFKMPNGVDPRVLMPGPIFAPPRLMPRLVQLTNAKFIAMSSAAGAGGSGDLGGSIGSMGFGQPTQITELAGVDDTSFYVSVQQMGSTEQSPLIYIEREPFTIRYYTGRGGGTGVDAILDRADELEWHTSGRNGVAFGHPYMLIKCKAA